MLRTMMNLRVSQISFKVGKYKYYQHLKMVGKLKNK